MPDDLDTEFLQDLKRWMDDPEYHLNDKSRRQIVDALTVAYAAKVRDQGARTARVREAMLYGGGLSLLLTIVLNFNAIASLFK